MAKKLTKTVTSWHELIEFVESMNPYKHTIVLSGFINRVELDNSIRIQQLVFSTKPVEILTEDGKRKTKRVSNSSKRKKDI